MEREKLEDNAESTHEAGIGRGFQGAAAPCVAHSINFLSQAPVNYGFTERNELANSGKLTGNLAHSEPNSFAPATQGAALT